MHVQSVYADHVMLVDCLFVMGIENQYASLKGCEKWSPINDFKMLYLEEERWMIYDLTYLESIKRERHGL